MTRKYAWIVALALPIVGAAGFSVLFARDAEPSNWKSLRVAYARANLNLAKARLAQAQNQNQLASGTVTKGTIALLQAGVSLAGAQLQQLEATSPGNPFRPQVVAAEQLIRILQDNHSDSLQANKIQAGTVSEPQLRRESAQIEVVKARLAELQAISQQPPETRIEWQISQLQDDVQALWARPLIQD